MISYITAFFGGGKSEKEKKIVSGIGKKVGVLSYNGNNIHLDSVPCGFQCERGSNVNGGAHVNGYYI